MRFRLITPYIGLYIVIYLYHLVVTKYPGDDVIFSEVPSKQSLVEWLTSRYMEWSSRLFPDAMAYLLLDHEVWLWRLLNPLMFILLAYALVRIWKKEVGMKDVVIVSAIMAFFPQGTLSAAYFWITGSLNYLWPLAMGTLAMIPYADVMFRNEPIQKKWVFSILVLCGFLASIGNEQLSLCLTCFALLFHLSHFWKKKRQDLKLLVSTAFIALGTSLTLLAPGNQVRVAKEAAYWFPGFEDMTWKEHAYVGTVWLFQKLFFDLQGLLLLAAIISLWASFKAGKTYVLIHWARTLLVVLTMLVLVIQVTGIGQERLYLFTEITHHPLSLHVSGGLILALVPYLFWTVYGVLVALLLIASGRHQWFTFFGVAAFLATLVVMFFSPTIYGSGNRVLTVGAVIVTLLLVGKIAERELFKSRLSILLLGCYPLVNAGAMLVKWLKDGFNPFL